MSYVLDTFVPKEDLKFPTVPIGPTGPSLIVSDNVPVPMTSLGGSFVTGHPNTPTLGLSLRGDPVKDHHLNRNSGVLTSQYLYVVALLAFLF